MIRLATRDDLPAIVAIYNESISGRAATADTEPVTVEDRAAWFAEHEPDSHPLFVYEENGAVVGWTGLSKFYGRPAYRHTAEVSTYIAEAKRGAGIGSKLRLHVLSECPRLGIQTVLSFVFAHNEPSVRLNERFGFAVWGQLPRVAVLDGVERDLLIMGKRIAE
jgi:phosphinothricin acetyltransferase